MKKLVLVLALFFSLHLYAQPGTACWRQISAGRNFSMAIKNDGTLWAWGNNGNLLGLNGNMLNQNAPIQVGTANDWLEVSAGATHTLAIKTNGTLWSWGDGLYGQLGNSLFNSATWTVTQRGTATDWAHVSAGSGFSLALKTNGTLWSWGYNSVGQLGQGNTTNLNVPTQVGTASNWAAIDAGAEHALALDNGGFLFAWGNNTFGQFGNGNNTSGLSPAPSTTSMWMKISAGFDHSLLLDPSGNMFAMGDNSQGELGDGTNTSSNVPIFTGQSSAGLINQYIEISAGLSFSLAIRADATLHSSGMNNSGQLGLGNTTNVNSFSQVGTLNTWQKISAGEVHSLALENSSDLWSTGRNIEGQLGIASWVNSNILQQVVCPNSPGLSISETNLDTDFEVYPNPAIDKITLAYSGKNLGNMGLTVTNLQGQILFSTVYTAAEYENHILVSLDDYSSGIYFLNVQFNDQQWSKRVVKK
jgi:alpha-tubulin suppressor-like RCC1 family protein